VIPLDKLMLILINAMIYDYFFQSKSHLSKAPFFKYINPDIIKEILRDQWHSSYKAILLYFQTII